MLTCLQAALTSKSPWLTPFGRENEADAVKRSFKVENSDFLTLYNAYCHWREASGNGYEREFTRVSEDRIHRRPPLTLVTTCRRVSSPSRTSS